MVLDGFVVYLWELGSNSIAKQAGVTVNFLLKEPIYSPKFVQGQSDASSLRRNLGGFKGAKERERNEKRQLS
jgi:hypothetical protein